MSTATPSVQGQRILNLLAAAGGSMVFSRLQAKYIDHDAYVTASEHSTLKCLQTLIARGWVNATGSGDNLRHALTDKGAQFVPTQCKRDPALPPVEMADQAAAIRAQRPQREPYKPIMGKHPVGAHYVGIDSLPAVAAPRNINGATV